MDDALVGFIVAIISLWVSIDYILEENGKAVEKRRHNGLALSWTFVIVNTIMLLMTGLYLTLSAFEMGH